MPAPAPDDGGARAARLVRAIAGLALTAIALAFVCWRAPSVVSAITGGEALQVARGDRIALIWAAIATVVLLGVIWRPLTPSACGAAGAQALLGVALLAGGTLAGTFYSPVLATDAVASGRRVAIWADARRGVPWTAGPQASTEAARLALLWFVIQGAQGWLAGKALGAAAGTGGRPGPTTTGAGALLLGGAIAVGFAYPAYGAVRPLSGGEVGLDLALLAATATAGAMGMMLGLRRAERGRVTLGVLVVPLLLAAVAIEALVGTLRAPGIFDADSATRAGIAGAFLSIDVAVGATVALVPLIHGALPAEDDDVPNDDSDGDGGRLGGEA